LTEHPSEGDVSGSDQPLREGMQAQIDIRRRGGARVEIDGGGDDLGASAAGLVGAHEGSETVVRGASGRRRLGGFSGLARAQRGEPEGEEDGGMDCGKSTCGNNAFCHASSLVGDGSTRLRDMTVDPSAETESAFAPTDELGGYLSDALDDPAELTGRLCAIESVSGHETALADAV